MHILITGIRGFTGSALAEALVNTCLLGQLNVAGIDNQSRAGSWLNWERLIKRGIKLTLADTREPSDLESLGPLDWIIAAAANPSVLAGVDGKSSRRQLLENNLLGTINLLELCKRLSAGFLLLSTSRVYSIEPLTALKVEVSARRFVPFSDQRWPIGIGPKGVAESSSVASAIAIRRLEAC